MYMNVIDTRIDAYIDKSAEFARPILTKLRALVHEACPDATETIKWGFPHFMYEGEILCSFASFKQHCVFGFWKAALMTDEHGLLEAIGKTAMGQLGRISDITELPPDKILKAYIKQAAKLNKDGIKLPAKPKVKAEAVAVPDYFKAELVKVPKALQAFEAFSNSHKKEYVEWITEAKTEATRAKRMATALEWLADGKARHWKHVKS